MDKKVVGITVAVVLVVAVVAVVFVKMSGTSSELTCERTENGYCFFGNVPSYLKFQEATEIDEQELFNYSAHNFLEYLLPVDPADFSEGYFCVDSEELPEIIPYFKRVCEIDDLDNCIHVRRAIVCETFYIVEDYDVMGYGFTMYGPYEN